MEDEPIYTDEQEEGLLVGQKGLFLCIAWRWRVGIVANTRRSASRHVTHVYMIPAMYSDKQPDPVVRYVL